MVTSYSQLLSYEITKALFDFLVTWYQSLFARSWVSVNVVLLSVPFQITTCIH